MNDPLPSRWRPSPVGFAFSVLRDKTIPQARIASVEGIEDAISTASRYGWLSTRVALVVESMAHGDRREVLDSFRSLGLKVTRPPLREVEHLSRDWPAATSQVVSAPIVLPMLALQRLIGRGRRIYLLSGFDSAAQERPPRDGGGDPAGDRSPTLSPTGPPPVGIANRIGPEE